MKTLYLCDRLGCENSRKIGHCPSETFCCLTSDIDHAVTYTTICYEDGKLVEKEFYLVLKDELTEYGEEEND